MKIEKVESLMVVAHATQLSQFTTPGGDVIIVIHTDKGNFSNFESVWKRQCIDAESLTEADTLEIAYTEYVSPKNGKVFKNFVSVRKLEEKNEA